MTMDPLDNDPPETFHFPPHPDEAAMRRYRDLPSPLELAHLAGSEASTVKRATSTARIEAALDRSIEAQKMLLRRREAMAADMDSTTLISLKGKLMADLNGDGKLTGEEYLEHPLVGPVLREYERRCSREGMDLQKSETDKIRVALESADRRSNPLKRPSLPCSLREALVYATGARGIDEAVLDHAFRDFLAVCEARNRHEIHTRIAAELRASIERYERSINTPSQPESEKDAGPKRRLKRTPEEIEQLKEQQRKRRENENKSEMAQLARIEARLLCAERFTPKTPISEELIKAAEATYQKYWAGAEAVARESSLAWIVEDFCTFWNQWGTVYLNKHEKSEAIKKAQKETKGRAATAATIQREHARLIRLTEGFLVFAKDQPSDLDSHILVDRFPKQPGVTIDRGKAFLKTLLTAIRNANGEQHVEELLRQEGFNAGPKTPPKINIGKGTIPECLNLLKNHFPRQRSKKVQ